MSELADLISRLEKLTGPDREVDARIWAEMDNREVRVEYCGHWRRQGLLARRREPPHDECVVVILHHGEWLTVGQSNPPAHYTDSLDAALTLLLEIQWFCLSGPHTPSGGRYREGPKRFDVAMVAPVDHSRGPTPAIALCIAALKARAQEKT